MTKDDLLTVLKQFGDNDEVFVRVWHPNQGWPVDLKVSRWDYEITNEGKTKLILVTQ